ncbi:clr5 domain-containing protein [Sarocladium implicatum]|nr:clr5 domain-containing protein [Sarocladium implicatum]
MTQHDDRSPSPQHDGQTRQLTLQGQKLTSVPETTTLRTQWRSPKDHTAGEWEAIRPIFTQLYLTDGRRLTDVSRILRDDHGFHATDKQFKDRIRKWKLRKNFKDKEKREALVLGVEAGAGSQIATIGATIPQRRLQRFARDAKLLYVRQVAAATPIPAVPAMEFDIVLELSRSMFDNGTTNDGRGLYATFAAIDRLAKQRTPALAFEVLGVSEVSVRYGLRRLERKSIPGFAFEMTRGQGANREQSLGIRYCGSVKTLLPACEPLVEEDEFHAALYHTINHSVYKACQYIYSPQSNPHNQALYQERRTVYRPALNPFNPLPLKPGQSPEVRCIQYNASSYAAKALYLRVMAQNMLVSGLRSAGNIPEAEILAQPHLGIGYRAAIGAGLDFVVALQPPLNVAMHVIKRGDMLACAIQFRPGYEGLALFMEGRLDREQGKLSNWFSAAATNSESKPETFLGPSPAANAEPFMTDDSVVETEFIAASRRAAVGSALSHPESALVQSAMVSSPMTEIEKTSGAGQAFDRLLAEGVLLDRAEPWKCATTPESSQVGSKQK